MSQIWIDSASEVKRSYNDTAVLPQGMLDFLYPAKTLALLRKLSSRQGDSARRSTGSAGLRHYSSKSFQRPSLISAAAQRTATAMVRAQSTTRPKVKESEDAAVLKDYLQDLDWIDTRVDTSQNDMDDVQARFLHLVKGQLPDDPASIFFDEVWDTFNNLNPSDQTTDAKILLANYLSFSERESDSIRLLFLTNSPEFETDFAVWRAITIRLFAGEISKAAEIHEAAQRQNLQTYIGSDVLLAHAIQAEDWKLALRTSTMVFNTLKRPYDRSVVQQAIHNLWSVTTRLPTLRDRASKFLAFAYERLDVQYFVIKAFVLHFLLATLSSIPQKASDVTDFLEEVRTYRVDEKPLLQFALEKIIHTTRKDHQALDSQLFDYLGTIWASYSKFCAGELNVPLIYDILRLFTLTGKKRAVSDTQERTLVLNILSACSTNRVVLPYEIMVSVLLMYAERGNTEIVRYLNKIMSPSFGTMHNVERTDDEEDLDAKRAYAVLATHIGRSEDVEAETAWTRLQSLHPQIASKVKPWEALIRIYHDQRRYGKIFDILFNRMKEAGASPTAGLLRLIIKGFRVKGNAPAVLDIMSLAKANGVEVNVRMIEELVGAHLRSGNAEASQEIAGMLQEYRQSIGFVDKRDQKILDQLQRACRATKVDEAEGIYNRLMESDRPVPSDVFSSMVKLYTRARSTDVAVRVAYVDMPKKNRTAGSDILGLLVGGYFHEHRYTEAIEMFDRIPDVGDVPNVTACGYWIVSLARLSRPKPNLDREILNGLRVLLNGRYSTAQWLREMPAPWHLEPYDVYFGNIIASYSEVQAWDIVNYLQKWYRQLQPGIPALGVIKSLMRAQKLAGNHAEVDRLFHMGLGQLSAAIRGMASDMTSLSMINHLEFGEIKDKQLFKSIPESQNSEMSMTDLNLSKVSPLVATRGRDSGRDIPFLIEYILPDYIDSLVARKQYDEIIRMMTRLQALGFNMDHGKNNFRLWNFYVQALCSSSGSRHIITAFRTAELHLYSSSAHFKTSKNWDKKMSKRLNQILHRRRLDQAFVAPRTMVILKEIALAAQRTSVNKASLGIEQYEDVTEDATVTLSSILEQVAPSMFPAVMAWEGNKYVSNDSSKSYFKDPNTLLAAKAKQIREAWWASASQEAVNERLEAYGPPQTLELYTELTASQENNYEPVTRPIGVDEGIEEKPIVTVQEVIEALRKEHGIAHESYTAPWQQKLYAPIIEEKAKAAAIDKTELSELGLKDWEAAVEHESPKTTEKEKQIDFRRLYAGQPGNSYNSARGRGVASSEDLDNHNVA